MEKNRKPHRRKTAISIIVFICAFVIAFAIAFYASRQYFSKDRVSELQQTVDEMNRKTPMEVDEITRLDSVAAKGDSDIFYYYTLPETEIAEINADTINKYVRPVIIDNAKNNPGLEILRKKKITMNYLYYDKNGEFIEEVAVRPDMYQ